MPSDEATAEIAAGELSWPHAERTFIDPGLESSEFDRPLTGAWRLDLAADALWWSPEIYEIFGVEPISFAPTLESVHELLGPDATARLQAECRRGRPPPHAEPFPIRRPDGGTRLLEIRWWTDGGGELRPRSILGTCRDVTDAAGTWRERPRLALAEAEERERLRIAVDIHDDTIQALGAVVLRLSGAGEHAEDDRVRALLADAEYEVRDVAERLRKLMFQLMPPAAGRDLPSMVETYCTVAFADSPIEYTIVGEVQGLAPDRDLVAYRLIQEALSNVLKHSHATQARVSFEQTAGELVLRVSDDGVGMGEGETPPTHAGLRIVRQRAEAAGGSAHFGVGLEGRGCSIQLRLPLRWSEP